MKIARQSGAIIGAAQARAAARVGWSSGIQDMTGAFTALVAPDAACHSAEFQAAARGQADG